MKINNQYIQEPIKLTPNTKCCYVWHDGTHWFNNPQEMLSEFHRKEQQYIKTQRKQLISEKAYRWYSKENWMKLVSGK